MANPQKENGYFSIANEIAEHLMEMPLRDSEWRILMCVLRKTYGWNKKEDVISLTQFEKATKLSRPTVVKALKNLCLRGILVKTALLAYSLQKDWEKWVVKPPLLVKNKNLSGLTVLTSGSKDRLTKTSKDRLTHKRKKESIKDIIQGQPTVARFGEETNKILEMFNKTINPTLGYANKTQRKAIIALIEILGYEKTTEATRYAISVQGQRYAPTITTPYQLKTKLAELRIYFEKQKGRKMKTINLDNL